MKTLTNKCASVEHKDTLSAIYVSEQCWALLRKWKSLSPIRLCYPLGCNSPWNSPGQNTGVGRLSLLQGIFPTQGLNPGLPHCGQILYQLSHKESPRTLEWVAYPFSRGSSQPRNQTRFSCIAGGFFTNWAMREAWDLLWWFGSLVAKSCLTLATPMDCSPPGSSVHGIFQAIILEWIPISFSRGSSQPRNWTQVSGTAGRFFTNWAMREAQRSTIRRKIRMTQPLTFWSS